MASTDLPTGTGRAKPAHGPITAGLIDWKADGVGRTPFGGANGPDAASCLLLKAQALTACLSAAFATANDHRECEFDLLGDGYKSLALDAIGDLILLAKALVDEA